MQRQPIQLVLVEDKFRNPNLEILDTHIGMMNNIDFGENMSNPHCMEMLHSLHLHIAHKDLPNKHNQ
jgi:hypothetical protein